ncbi:MAG: hypothetical protein ACO3EZ_17010 [Prochlorotrichaceae cyanobacterium]
MEFAEWLEDRYKPYLSSYLQNGWKSDRHYIKSIDLTPETIVVAVDVLHSYYPKTAYYFSTIHAIPLLYQFVILHACWENQWPEKPGDVYLRDLHIETPRMIQQQENIRFVLNLVARRSTPQWLYYAMQFTIGDEGVPQAFRGSLKYAVPRPVQRA